MVTQNLPKYQYRVDATDVVVWVNSWWLAFAKENGAAELTEASILGRQLWDFVAGDDTRRLYMDIHARLRKSGKPAVIVFRCDSPSLQRHMQLTITREQDRLLYESVLVRAQPRRRLNLLDSEYPRSDSFLVICSVCERALLEPAGWLDVEEISIRLRLFEERKVPELRYTVCPACAEIMRVASSD